MRTFKLILITLLLFSCNQKKEKKINNSSNTLFINLSNKNNFTIHDKLKFSKVVQLETRKDNLIGEVNKIAFQYNRYFIQDMKRHMLFVFDANGNFIRQIGRRGNGPGEYSDLRDFSVSNDSLLFLLTYKRIMVYNLDGDYLRSINIKDSDKANTEIYLNPLQLATINGETFYLWQGTFGFKNHEGNMPFLLYKLSSNGNLLPEAYFPVLRKTNHGIRFYPCYNGINITPPLGTYSIYKIADNKISENVKIDFAEYTIKESQLEKGFSINVAEQEHDLRMNSKYCVLLDNFLETKEYYYFKFHQKGLVYQVLYSKKTDNYTINKASPFTIMQCTANEFLISVLKPIFFEHLSDFNSKGLISNEIYKKLRDLKIDINSNPLLIQYEVQDF